MSEERMERQVEEIHKKEQFWHKYVFQIILLIFVAGGGWVTLDNVQALAEENKQQIAKEKEDTNAIKEDIITIRVTQEYIKRDLELAKEVAKENSDKLDAILNELRKRDD